MMDRTVTVFGQGHFGTPLTARLREISPEGVSILPVAKRENNKEAAFRSGLAVLTVRPEQVAQTLSDIKTPPEYRRTGAFVCSECFRQG